MRRLLATALITSIMATLVMITVSAPAQARGATRCWDNGGQYPRCVTELKSSKRLHAVETISFQNKTDHRKHFTCTFTSEVSRAMTTGGSITATGKTTIFKVIEASVAVTVHQSVTQTARQATAAGFDGYVGPHQTIYCDRMYGYVQSRVKIYQNYTRGDDYVDYRTIRTPINLGVRVRQG